MSQFKNTSRLGTPSKPPLVLGPPLPLGLAKLVGKIILVPKMQINYDAIKLFICLILQQQY